MQLKRNRLLRAMCWRPPDEWRHPKRKITTESNHLHSSSVRLSLIYDISLLGPFKELKSTSDMTPRTKRVSFFFFFFHFSVENETRCYGEIGCLNITREWYHLIHRPLNLFPLPRSVINTRFILYTESNPVEGQLLVADDKEAIKKTNFNPKWPTKFIIHGFIDTPLSNWVSEMRDELIVRKNLNVIVVDWAGGSLPLYTQVCCRRVENVLDS